jgi:hypothetical protein
MNADVVQALHEIAQALHSAVWPQSVVEWAQVALVFLTAATLVVLWIYTRETVRLRQATEKQVDVSHFLLKAAQEQNEASIRPILQIVCTVENNSLSTFTTCCQLRNLGTGPAFNIAIDSVQWSKITYLFRNLDTLGTNEETERMEEFCPLRSAHSATGEPVAWDVFFGDALKLPSRTATNLTIHYQNATGRAYFSHEVITFEKDSAVPNIRLLDSGPQS